MKVDFEQQLKTITGIPMVEPELDEKGEPKLDENGKQIDKPVTLKTAVLNALLAQFKDENNLGGEEKLKRWELARKIHGGADSVEAEEIVKIKELVGKAYTAAVVGPVYTMLEGE